jgi:hypothetical protein
MEHVRRVSREFPTGERAVLHVEARSGSVVVDARRLESVQVEAEVHIWSDDEAVADEAVRLVEDGIEQDGRDRVIIRAPSLPDSGGGWNLLGLGRRGARIDYRVRVPVRTSVRVLSRSGRVEVTGTEGRAHVEVLSGRCELRDITGETTVNARSGSVHVERANGDVQAEARSGRVRITDVQGNVTAESRSGVIELARISGEVRARARSGPVTIEEAGGAVHARSRAGPLRFRGAVRGDLDIEVITGPITLEVDPDQPFYVDAESRIGQVTSDLPRRSSNGVPGNAGPKVRLRTHVGPIRLTRER